MDDEGTAENSMLTRVRELPVGRTPEDVMRNLMDKQIKWKNRSSVIQFLDDLLIKHPEIEGILGYSEGAAIAASYIIDEQRRLKETGRTRRIKRAIFFTGWPPFSDEPALILSDESDAIVDVPTLHVVGANGEYFFFQISELFQNSLTPLLDSRSVLLRCSCVV
jgi:predicted esterase